MSEELPSKKRSANRFQIQNMSPNTFNVLDTWKVRKIGKVKIYKPVGLENYDLKTVIGLLDLLNNFFDNTSEGKQIIAEQLRKEMEQGNELE